MQKRHDQLIFSPSDLTAFMASRYGSWMQRFSLEQPLAAPARDPADELMRSLRAKGEAHEQTVLVGLQQQGRNIVEIDDTIDDDQKRTATLAAMRSGADIIYQALLSQPQQDQHGFRGFADFLVRVEGNSQLGDYHYEVWDSKLSGDIKASFIVQLCCYVDILAKLQGRRPESIAVVGADGQPQHLRVDDYYFFYLGLKRNFLLYQQGFDPQQPPNAADEDNWGDWSQYAQQQLLERDHLSQVATISRRQIKRLHAASITSLAQLAAFDENEKVPGLHQQQLIKLCRQAAIQLRSRNSDDDRPAFEVIPPKTGERNGLALLPPPAKLDIFFDIEGYPLTEGGLEYLWGSSYFDDAGERQFKDFWAHDSQQEKQAFSDFIEWAYDRWQRDPDMHIYHYANYEIAACRRLMGRYGICEHEVDELLRHEVFVDLYKVVKSGILLGEPRYSIKNVEHLYRPKRDTTVVNGGDSVVVYERWRDHPDGQHWRESSILRDIRLYNIDDCESTQELVDWLRQQQQRHNIDYLALATAEPIELSEEVTLRSQLCEQLLAKAASLEADNHTELAELNRNYAWSLEFHRREAKPIFWRLFDRLGMDHDELLDDLDCLALCQRTDKAAFKPTARARNLVYEYRFDLRQQFKGGKFKQFYLLGSEGAKVTLNREHSDIGHGIIALQSKEEPAASISLIPDEFINARPIPEAIFSVAKSFADNSQQTTAIDDFLRRRPPRLKSGSKLPVIHNHDELIPSLTHTLRDLDHSYLTIQGPPGAGKTYTGKQLIAELIADGKRIGICSNSHKAINNLLVSTKLHCDKIGVNGYFACSSDTGEDFEALAIEIIKNNKIDDRLNEHRACVIGTTAWGFSRAELQGQFDYLFIDEAGQVSVANLIAISQCCQNIILMGDQMQLGQPIQGSHPGDSGLSVLDYLLRGAPTIDTSMGVFLDTSYRMHPSICQFISSAIYANKLHWANGCEQQTIALNQHSTPPLDLEAGIVYQPLQHSGNSQASDEEVGAIAELSQTLIGRIFTNSHGVSKAISLDDMLFVAPYNHQVEKLRAKLGNSAKIGSVDKFQGQEAAIVFLSMCASDANDSPRGMEFLFDQNRLNVAVSRAHSLVIIVASQSLENTRCETVAQLKLLNTYHQLIACSTTI